MMQVEISSPQKKLLLYSELTGSTNNLTMVHLQDRNM